MHHQGFLITAARRHTMEASQLSAALALCEHRQQHVVTRALGRRVRLRSVSRSVTHFVLLGTGFPIQKPTEPNGYSPVPLQPSSLCETTRRRLFSSHTNGHPQSDKTRPVADSDDDGGRPSPDPR